MLKKLMKELPLIGNYSKTLQEGLIKIKARSQGGSVDTRAPVKPKKAVNIHMENIKRLKIKERKKTNAVEEGIPDLRSLSGRNKRLVESAKCVLELSIKKPHYH